MIFNKKQLDGVAWQLSGRLFVAANRKTRRYCT